jgi:hypothetical protein
MLDFTPQAGGRYLPISRTTINAHFAGRRVDDHAAHFVPILRCELTPPPLECADAHVQFLRDVRM